MWKKIILVSIVLLNVIKCSLAATANQYLVFNPGQKRPSIIWICDYPPNKKQVTPGSKIQKWVLVNNDQNAQNYTIGKGDTAEYYPPNQEHFIIPEKLDLDKFQLLKGK